jgi:hypothetical protein
VHIIASVKWDGVIVGNLAGDYVKEKGASCVDARGTYYNGEQGQL